MAFQYINKIREILADVEKEESGKIEQAAQLMVTATMDKHSVYIFGPAMLVFYLKRCIIVRAV
ncbi:hypothetical protein S101258_00263 [Lactiplantibacillus plantarum subsp. plantarum]|uniref:SIS domain-containing protein n=1 Tax=Lactiplantibacillus plantarum subsp. plantarum TaxID=337330 RepID=A0A2S3U9N2_LACPN|nr:hypothetical protein S101258_00263 [Lactiplantibacillus plantarum subsp. plantarum]